MRRFFFSEEQRRGEMVELSRAESKHICRVLRLELGTKLELLDGKGGVFVGAIVELEPVVVVEICSELPAAREQVSVRVAQGILKGQKMDLVVQKCTELGAEVLIPYQAGRSQGVLSHAQADKKCERWQRISLESCKQCMREKPMTVAPVVSFIDLIDAAQLDGGRCGLIFWEEEREVTLDSCAELRSAAGVDIILGPEGGITPEEIEYARSRGWRTVSLGRRILRAETAAIVGLTLIQYLTGNLS